MLTHLDEEIKLDHKVSSSKMADALDWTTEYTNKICEFSIEKKFVKKDKQENLLLTESGQKKVKQYAVR